MCSLYKPFERRGVCRSPCLPAAGNPAAGGRTYSAAQLLTVPSVNKYMRVNYILNATKNWHLINHLNVSRNLEYTPLGPVSSLAVAKTSDLNNLNNNKKTEVL